MLHDCGIFSVPLLILLKWLHCLKFESVLNTDNPMCFCGEVDGSYRFRFECAYYNALRKEMLSCVSTVRPCNPSLQILLQESWEKSSQQICTHIYYQIKIEKHKLKLSFLDSYFSTNVMCPVNGNNAVQASAYMWTASAAIRLSLSTY